MTGILTLRIISLNRLSIFTEKHSLSKSGMCCAERLKYQETDSTNTCNSLFIGTWRLAFLTGPWSGLGLRAEQSV
jgi:hypothetical protein